MTITQFFTDNRLIFNLDGTGTSTTQIYTGTMGEPITVEVNGETVTKNFNPSTNILTITVTHASIEQVEINWLAGPLNILALLRGNYYLVFALISIAPIMITISLLLGAIKGKSLNPKDITGILAVIITFVLAFIIVVAILNSFIGS